MVKIKIPFSEFIELTKINYDEDLYTSGNVYQEYEKYGIDEIIYNLPKKYKNKFTRKRLEQDEETYTALVSALNDASYHSLVNECSDVQDKAVEKFANDLVDYINKINETGIALRSIDVDWKNEEVIISTGSTNETLKTILEIINGDGMFHADDIKEFVESCGESKREVIKNHLHYLFDVNSIDKIFGLFGKPQFNWEVSYVEINEKIFEESIEDTLTDEQKNLSAKTNIALSTLNKMKEARDEAKAMSDKLDEQMKNLSKRDLKAFNRIRDKKLSQLKIQ